MSIFRSEKMGLYHIAMSKESAYEVLSELGDLGTIQFIDQDPNESHFNRPFSRAIKRCEDLESKLQIIINQAKLYNAEITPQKDIAGFLRNLKEQIESREKAPHTYVDDVEAEINQKEAQLSEQIRVYEKFQEQVLQLNEYKAVLQQSKDTLAEQLYGRQNFNIIEDEEAKDGVLQELAIGLSYMAGVIETNDLLRFKRMIFRATRGNCWLTSHDIPTLMPKKSPISDFEEDAGQLVQKEEPVRKATFLIIYQGGQNEAIKNKLTRIADSFGATRYPLPADPSNYMKKMMEIEGQILEQTNTMRMTSRTIEKTLKEQTMCRGKSQCSWIEELRLFILREKSIYSNMNLLNIKNEIYDGYYWCPEILADDVDTAIKYLHNRKVYLPQTTITPKDIGHRNPPTHFETNEFTAAFQDIVNTYGMARYQEINPGIFCVGMFPLKFGIMFGDIGHGALLLTGGILMTLFSDQLKQNGMEQVASVRYVFLLAGIFATYCGFIYNDFFSLPFNLFGSCFKNIPEHGTTEHIAGCVYPLGLDPKWYIAKNELTFMNSLKMKVSVIIGVIQMLWGIILKGMNCIYNRAYVDFIFEFIPQFVFLICTFGYMDFLIFYKWSTDFSADTSRAPSIISQMINLPLKVGSTGGYPLWDVQSQESLQFYFLMISLTCVPLMLLPKPFILLLQSKIKAGRRPPTSSLQQGLLDSEEALKQNLQAEKAKSEGHGHGHGHGEEFEFGEAFVHQVIETIEFVLGSISNTASYLRLWALSLAHGQLAKVFFEKTLGGGIQGGNIIAIFIGLTLFVIITLGVIMAMDLMECFLHALRLQWVEFQNKFYKADGYKFEPFSFQTALKTVEV